MEERERERERETCHDGQEGYSNKLFKRRMDYISLISKNQDLSPFALSVFTPFARLTIPGIVFSSNVVSAFPRS
jgi:hypothetical protein